MWGNRFICGGLLPACAFLTLASCAPAPAPAPTPAPVLADTPAPTLNEPPILDWMAAQPVPTFLDAEQQQLFLHAYSAASFLMGCDTMVLEEYPRFDGSVPDLSQEGWAETVEHDGWTYFISIGRYRRWEDFQAMLDSLFTPEYQQELLYAEFGDGASRAMFCPTQNGLLAYLEASRGSDFDYGWCDTPDSYELVSRSEDEIVFHLIGHYAQFAETEDFGGVPEPVGEYTRAYPIRMERTEKGWRFAEFYVPY